MTRKKISFDAKEQNATKIAEFILATEGIASHNMFFLDETSTDKRTYTRPYGRALIGRRARGFRVFVRGQRYSSSGTYSINTVLKVSVARHVSVPLFHSLK